VGLFGLGPSPVIVALALYSLVILVANLVDGLRAVPRPVVEAATAMGYRPWERLLRVELPLAVPALVAGLRAASVSTISLVSVGAVIGTGGLGQLFIHGFQIDNPVEIWVGLVATLLLALAADLLVVAVGRSSSPWTKEVR
jgi:osmoprotectant transport system permease protein